ncbi:hypothetical protein KI688_005497 [Linnemannia hyalina]|uniref:Uncharacterized protein n=1 Tax=Linnemannia hyalina TaxID=64524 RepID=A0A9P7Y1X2_9FUNG|nr:hypothetical protein KI688_005497 [Linnemannia hyalina]
MGLKGLYWWLRRKKGYNPTLRHPKRYPLPDDAMVRVDVLSFYSKILWAYIKYAHDKSKAHAILFAHIKKYGDPLRMVFYVDGLPALEKKEAHHERNAKRVKALMAAEVATNTLSEHEFKVLEYNKVSVLAQIGLSTTKFTALASVSSNDYNKNIPSLGIATNYKIIKDLPDGDVPSLVQEYLRSPHVVGRNQDEIDFTASILVFTTMTQEIAVPAGVISDPSSTAQSVTPLTTSSAPSMSYNVLLQQYHSIKEQHELAKAQKRMITSSKSDTKPEREGKHKEFRRHHVIDRPAHQPGFSRQVHRPRYSPKARSKPQQHEPPYICRQYQLKPYTAKQEARYQQSIAENEKKQAEKMRQRDERRLKKEMELLKKPPRKIEEMDKQQLINAMVWEHPLVSLPVGTIRANSNRAAAGTTTDDNQLPSSKQQQQQQQSDVSACILDIVEQARTIFERGQTEEDRTILNTLCPTVKSKIRLSPKPHQDSQESSSSSAGTTAEDAGEEDLEDDVDEDAEPSAMDKPFIAFYQILLAHICSPKTKFKTVIERQVGQLLARAASLGIALPPAPRRMVSYSTSALLESTTKQFYRSINSQPPCQPGTTLPKINSNLPAIENYLRLNKSSGRLRRIAPLSPLAARYIGFSERQLLPLFWAWPVLKDKIRSMIIKDRFFQDPTINPSQADALNWLTSTTPGRFVTTFLSDVGLPPNKHDKGFRKTTTIMDMDGKDGKEGLREHLGCLRAEKFDPKEWHGKGYVLKGSIHTNGRLLQLLAFKLKEIQSVRYRRFPENKLPNALVTTIGGTNGYLTEVRNVFSTATDVENLSGADPSQVGVLSLDLGTSCLIGATISLPPGQTPATLAQPHGKERDKKLKKKKRHDEASGSPAHKLKEPQTTRYFDLVVKRKAVSRPSDSFAGWLEDRKEFTTGSSTGRAIQDIETALPPLMREGASFREYVAARRASEEDLDNFYNQTNFWKHKWDSEVCRQEEFCKVAEGLLKMIGGSVGRPRMPHRRVVIAIGLAKFTGVHGPPGLNGTFQAFFINLVGHIFATTARSLGYLVIGISEYFSSKRCPYCHDFVCATSDWWTLFCKICKRFWQRDVMASKNMNNAIKGHLIHQQRPLYLQPQRRDGTYPWMDVTTGGDSGGGGGGEGADGPPEAMDVNVGGNAGGGSAAASPSMAATTTVSGPTRKRRATSIVSVEDPNTDVVPTADTPSVHTKNKSRK